MWAHNRGTGPPGPSLLTVSFYGHLECLHVRLGGSQETGSSLSRLPSCSQGPHLVIPPWDACHTGCHCCCRPVERRGRGEAEVMYLSQPRIPGERKKKPASHLSSLRQGYCLSCHHGPGQHLGSRSPRSQTSSHEGRNRI